MAVEAPGFAWVEASFFTLRVRTAIWIHLPVLIHMVPRVTSSLAKSPNTGPERPP